MLSSEQIDDGWLPHDGGAYPVDGLQWVLVKFRGPLVLLNEGIWQAASFAAHFVWHHDCEPDDIIAYKPEPHP